MYFNTNFEPHLSALFFLGTAGLLILLSIASLIFFFRGRKWLRYAATAMPALLIGYMALLLTFSAVSRERTLAPGQEKYFCELDCRLAYSVQKVERAKQIGDQVANGEFYIVTVRNRFDETTTASWRPREVPLTPVPLTISLIDRQGDVIRTSASGQQAWDALHGVSPSLFKPIRPGESVEAIFVFDVPPAMQSPRLLASFTEFPT